MPLCRRRAHFNPNIALSDSPQANTPELFHSPSCISRRSSNAMQAAYNNWLCPHHPCYGAVPNCGQSAPVACCNGWRTEWHNPTCPNFYANKWPWGGYYPHTDAILYPPTRTALPHWDPPQTQAAPVVPHGPNTNVYRDVYHYGLIAGQKKTAEQVNEIWRQDIWRRHPRCFWYSQGIPP